MRAIAGVVCLVMNRMEEGLQLAADSLVRGRHGQIGRHEDEEFNEKSESDQSEFTLKSLMCSSRGISAVQAQSKPRVRDARPTDREGSLGIAIIK